MIEEFQKNIGNPNILVADKYETIIKAGKKTENPARLQQIENQAWKTANTDEVTCLIELPSIKEYWEVFGVKVTVIGKLTVTLEQDCSAFAKANHYSGPILPPQILREEFTPQTIIMPDGNYP